MFSLDNEEEQYQKMEALHESPVLRATFHNLIARTTLWRFCVFCGEPIPREGTLKIKVIDAKPEDVTKSGDLSE